ncbi:MAG: DegT/DnrJ/EryC1/StrS family aminotransferase [Candidatus Dormibacter sp.]
MERIPVAGPWITDKEVAYVTDAVRTAWYGEAHTYETRFEDAFKAYVSRRYAMALPSATSAIHLALASLGIGPGDEVIVPEATWIATAAPIAYVGATPVFADIDPQSWCISPASLEACITPRTRAVIVVNLYGGMPDMDAIDAIADRHQLAVIEDAAESIGAEYRRRRAGSFGDASVFSFHGSKTLTTGEGGMLLTDDESLYQRALILRDHGRAPASKAFWNQEVAFKYRMSSMQAALGLAQLERVQELIERKQQIFGWYREGLDGARGVTLNYAGPMVVNAYWMVTAVFDGALGLLKEPVAQILSGRGIDTRPFFYPLSSLPAYAALPQAREAASWNRHAYDVSRRAINLPSALNLTQTQVAYVCTELRRMMTTRAAA